MYIYMYGTHCIVSFLFLDILESCHNNLFFVLVQGFVLVYDITSRSSFDLVVTVKHKISMRHREVSILSRQGLNHVTFYFY